MRPTPVAPVRVPQRQRTALLQVLAASFLWGAVPVGVKLALPTFDPYAISFLRYALGTAFLFLAVKAQGDAWRWSRVPLGLMLLGGAASALNYNLYTLGIHYTTASAASFIIQGEMVALLALAWVFLKETWTGVKAVGAAVCMAGVMIVGWNGVPWEEIFNSQTFVGNVLVFFAGVAWAGYTVCQKIALRYADTLQTLIAFFLVSSGITGLTWLLAGTPPQFSGATPVVSMALLGVLGTGVSYLLITTAMNRLNAGVVGLWTAPLPLVTAALAFLLLGERPTLYTWSGGALVLAGLLVLSREEE